MIRKTSEGVLVTTGGVRLFVLILGAAATVITGAIGAVRFMALAVPTRTEFHDHIVSDSAIHREQAIHSAFQDSALSRAVRDNHATSCYIAKYPLTLCADLTLTRP